MVDNQNDIPQQLNSNMVAREVFPAVEGIADNVQQEAPKNTVPKFLRKHLRNYPKSEILISNDGSFGVVLKVYSALIGTAVLKEPRNVTERQWDREVESIYSLNYNPHIVALYGYVYDKYTDPQPRGFLMEYMLGGTLHEFVVANKREPLPEEVKNTWSKQIALGLNFVHSRDIMHRDLKPNNILLNETRRVAKIADFGLSRPVDIAGQHTNNIGNLLYTAPEVYDSAYNKSADVWSYGMLLYFIHYLKHPFDEEEFKKMGSCKRSKLLSGKENGTPLRPPLQGKNIDDIIVECWKSEPDDRYSMIKVVNEFHNQSGVQKFPSYAI